VYLCEKAVDSREEGLDRFAGALRSRWLVFASTTTRSNGRGHVASRSSLTRDACAVRRIANSGRDNVTGLWSDLGRFKTPTLRGLSARAPYFHNGIAAGLEDVVHHYEAHLGFVFTDGEEADLVAFLEAL